jgi:hypothetical protein
MAEKGSEGAGAGWPGRGLPVAPRRRLLAEARAQLEREAEARSRLEDNMKRAFMRGATPLSPWPGRAHGATPGLAYLERKQPAPAAPCARASSP